MKFTVVGKIHHKNGEEQSTVIEISADDKEEAKFFFRHEVRVEEFPEATVSVDLRRIKTV